MTAKNVHGLTTQMEEFAQKVALGVSQVGAYRASHPDSQMNANAMYVAACRLAQQPKVVLRVRELQATIEKRFEIHADKILRELATIAFLDKRELFDADDNLLPPSQWPEHIARNIERIEVTDDIDPTGKVVGRKTRYYLPQKTPALRLLGVNKKLFIERMEVGAPGEFDGKTDEEIEAAIKAGEEALKAIETARRPKAKPVKKAAAPAKS